MASSNDKIYGVKEHKKKTIYDTVNEYMVDKYDIRFDELGHEFQISLRNQNEWEVLEINSFNRAGTIQYRSKSCKVGNFSKISFYNEV